MSTLVFDTNIFNRMIARNGSPYCEKIFRELQSGLAVEQPLHAVTTPALVLESLGIKSKAPDPNLIAASITTDDPRTAKREVYALAENYFRGLPEFTEDALRTVYQGSLTASNPNGRRLLQDIIGSKLTPGGLSRYLIQSLATDYHYGFNYRLLSNLSRDALLRIHVNFLLDVCEHILGDSNVSPARGLFEISEELRKRNRTTVQVIREALSVKKGLKLYGDRGDLDIIHLSTMGAMVGQTRNSIFAITGDPVLDVRRRVLGYKSLVHHFLAKLRHIANNVPESPLTTVTMLPGTIAVIDQTSGTLSEIIDVAALEPAQ